MSILIKGMEMPKSCGFCAFYNWDYWWCGAIGKEIKHEEINNIRNKDCPLVPIPPHGRLIDADDIENITVIMNENGTGFNRIVAPTIIEAEEGE